MINEAYVSKSIAGQKKEGEWKVLEKLKKDFEKDIKQTVHNISDDFIEGYRACLKDAAILERSRNKNKRGKISQHETLQTHNNP